jgi:hypothetical protein
MPEIKAIMAVYCKNYREQINSLFAERIVLVLNRRCI